MTWPIHASALKYLRARLDDLPTDPISDSTIARVWDGVGSNSNYDPGAGRDVDPAAVAHVILRKHWGLAACFCPPCVVARTYLNHRELRRAIVSDPE